MRELHAATLLSCFFVLLWCRYYLRFPLFTIYVGVATFQFLAYHPESPTWLASVYSSVEPALVALRVLCAFEVLVQQAAVVPREGRLLAGLAFASVPYVCLACLLSFPAGKGMLAGIVSVRRCAQIGTAIFIFAGEVFLGIFELWKKNVVFYHSMILTTLLLKQGAISVLALRSPWSSKGWYAADSAGLAINCFCWTSWMLLALLKKREIPLGLADA